LIKLLVVDDESATRNGLMKHINWRELAVDVVEEAKDGIEGLEAAGRLHPDIMISDIRMPGMNGIELATSIREQFPECKIIFLSGYSDKEYLKAAIHLNAVNYVEKPINIDELQGAIKKAVHLCIADKKIKHTENHMTLALSESLPFIRQNIVNGLIYNKMDSDELNRHLHIVGVSFNPSDHYTASIIVPSFEGELTADAKQSCCNAIIEFLHQSSSGFTHLGAMKDPHQILVISAHRAKHERDFDFVYHLLTEHLKQNKAFKNISWIVGSTAPQLSGISDSYKTASEFLKVLFYYDYGNIFYSKNLSNSSYPINEDIIQSFAALLQDPEKEKIIHFIENLYQTIKTKTGTPVDEVKNLFYQMMLMLMEEGEKRGVDLSRSRHEEEEYLWALMSKIDTFKHLLVYFLNKAEQILDNIKNIESNSKAVLEVIKYIRSHYSDKEITVNMLAELVHLTPTYLSTLFRKETGKTLSEYITEVRIDSSADLLMKPQVKLYEIAEQSGYNDANYFSKAFKKIKGMTPSQFRRRFKS
jgi:two-component system, response regulator YesN